MSWQKDKAFKFGKVRCHIPYTHCSHWQAAISPKLITENKQSTFVLSGRLDLEIGTECAERSQVEGQKSGAKRYGCQMCHIASSEQFGLFGAVQNLPGIAGICLTVFLGRHSLRTAFFYHGMVLRTCSVIAR